MCPAYGICPACGVNLGIDLASTIKGETNAYLHLAYGYGSTSAGKTLCHGCYSVAATSTCARSGKHKHQLGPNALQNGIICSRCLLHYPAGYILNGSNCGWCLPELALPPINVTSDDEIIETPAKKLPPIYFVLNEYMYF